MAVWQPISMTPERFRFPGPQQSSPFHHQYAAAALLHPALQSPHPLTAHHHPPHPHPHSVLPPHHPHHPHHPQQHPLVAASQVATFSVGSNRGGGVVVGVPGPTPQPAHSHHHHHPLPHPHHLHHHLQHLQHQQQQQQQQHHLQYPVSRSSLMPVMPILLQPLSICQEELDMVLYGYAKGSSSSVSSSSINKSNTSISNISGSSNNDSEGYHLTGHALSGLNLSQQHVAAVEAQAAAQAAAAVAAAAAAAATASAAGAAATATTTTSGSSTTAAAATAVSSSRPASSSGGGGGGGRVSSLSSSSSSTESASSHPLQPGEQPHPEPVNFGIDKILATPKCPSKNTMSQAAVKKSQPVLDTASLELPEGIAIVQTALAGTVHYGVFCTRTVISRSTRFGPFKGRIIHTSEIKTHDDNSYMWEIFQDGKLSHFIDGRGPAGNWMAHVKCARYAQEQNLIAVQADGAIWYEVCKDIPQGTELLVWYGDCYLQFMGVPVALKEMADGGAQEEADTSEGFQCERCSKVFAYRYYRDKHLKYTRCVDQGDRKYPCTLCTRSFEKRDRLRIHILHVHEKHRPHKCLVCGKSFSQSSSLNKHMRVHSGERPYKCVYCNKAFTASSILRTHIRQHSGEKPFKCKYCGKAFASHAAHDSHVRRTHGKEKPSTCSVCGKVFAQSFELKLHMNSHISQQ